MENTTNELIENGYFITGTRLFVDMVKDIKSKYDLSRLAKKVEKLAEEPMDERADLIRLHFPKKTIKDEAGNGRTDHFVEPESLEEKARLAWKAAIKEWRSKPFPFPRTEVLKIEIEKSKARTIPHQVLMATDGFIEVAEIEDSKTTAIEQLEAVSKKLDEVKKGLKA